MSYKKIKYISAFFFLLFCQPAFAWEKFKTYEIWIDKDSIYSKNISGDKIVYIWAIWNVLTPNNEGYRSIKSQRNIDCNEHSVAAVDFIYSLPDGGGKELGRHLESSGSIEPDTFDNELLKDFCKDWWKVW